jgi:peroxiredoxin
MRRWITRNWSVFRLLVLAFGAAWMVFFPPAAGSVTGGGIPAPREGFLAPAFTLQDGQGNMVSLESLRGRPVLLNLWASWCPPCRAEMPAMQAVYEQYAAQGFVILAVNTTYQDDPQAARQFAENLGLTFPILYDLDGSASRQYQVRSMPTSFFIGADGVIRRVVIGGPMAEALLRAETERLLEQASPVTTGGP